MTYSHKLALVALSFLVSFCGIPTERTNVRSFPGADGRDQNSAGTRTNIQVKFKNANITNNPRPTWEWDSGEGGSGKFRFKFNDRDLSKGATVEAVLRFTPPQSLDDGEYSLFIQELRQDGNWSDVDSSAIRVDTVPPAMPVVAAAAPLTNSLPVWTWQGAADGAGFFRVSLGSEEADKFGEETKDSSYTAAAASDGDNFLYVKERDAAGNWSPPGFFKVVYDRTPPTAPSVFITTPTNNVREPWRITSTGGGSGVFRVKFGDGNFDTDATELTDSNPADGISVTYTPSSDMVSGRTLFASERDAAGNWSPAGNAQVVIDGNAPPAPVLLSLPAAVTNNTTPNFTWSSSLTLFRVRLDNGSWSGNLTAKSYTAPSLGAGGHKFEVQARHATIATSWSGSAMYEFTIDLTPPNAPIVSRSPATAPQLTKNQKPEWLWNSGGGGGNTRFRYKLDSQAWSPETAAQRFSSATNLTDGAHTLLVQERDAAGNWSASGEALYTVDATGPNAPTCTAGTTGDRRPTWTWVTGAGGGNGSYRVKIDNADLSSGATGVTGTTFQAPSDLTFGAHKLYVQERDNAENWSPAKDCTMTVQAPAAAAPVFVNVVTPTNNLKPTWNWNSGNTALGNGTFEYKLNSGALQTTTNRTFTPATDLAAGTHKLEVREQNLGGQSGPWASKDIVIERTAPGAPNVQGPRLTNSKRPTWSWTAAASPSDGIRQYQIELKKAAAVILPLQATSNNAFTPASDLSDGVYTLRVQERDLAGNWSAAGSADVEVDSSAGAPPVVSAEAGAADTTKRKPTWNWTTGGGSRIYRFKLDVADLSNAPESSAVTFTPGSDLSYGDHTLYVQEKDSAGNWSAAGQDSISVRAADAARPVLAAGSSPSPTNANPVLWVWTSGGGGVGTYRYRLDNADLSSVPGVPVQSFPGFDLANGPHTLYVQERNASDNWGPKAEFTIVVDRAAPSPPVISGPTSTREPRPSWTWVTGGGEGNGRFRFKLNSGTFDASEQGAAVAVYRPTEPLRDGSYTIYVQERDEAGNWSPSASLETVVDSTPPAAPNISSPEAPVTTATRRPTWNWTSGGNGGAGLFRFQVFADTAVTNPDLSAVSEVTDLRYQPENDLAFGDHVLFVEERDALGNWSAKSKLIIDVRSPPAGVPNVQLASGTTSPTSNRRPGWSWSSNASDSNGNGQFRYALDNQTAWSASAATTTYTPPADLTAGIHTLYVQEQNHSGQWSEAGNKSVEIDLEGPSRPVFSGPPASTPDPTSLTTLVWAWTSGGGGGSGTYQVALNSSDFSTGAEMLAATTYSRDVTALLATTHDFTLYLREKDAHGNWSPAASRKVTVSTAGPNAPLVTSSEPNPTKNAQPEWTWTSGGGGGAGQYRVSFNSATFTGSEAVITDTAYVHATPLSSGSYNLYVQERNALGTWSASGTFEITVDVTAPGAPNVTSGVASTTNTRPEWTWTSGGGGNGQFKHSFTNDIATATATTATQFIPPNPLSEGTHILYVWEQDAAGNISAPGSFAVEVKAQDRPAKPTGLRLDKDPQQFRVRWDEVDGTDIKYMVVRRADQTKRFTPVNGQAYASGFTDEGSEVRYVGYLRSLVDAKDVSISATKYYFVYAVNAELMYSEAAEIYDFVSSQRRTPAVDREYDHTPSGDDVIDVSYRGAAVYTTDTDSAKRLRVISAATMRKVQDGLAPETKNPSGLLISANRAFVSVDKGVAVFNIGQAAPLDEAPELVKFVDLSRPVFGMSYAGGYLYLALGSDGFISLLTNSDAMTPFLVEPASANLHDVRMVRVDGNHLYVADAVDGLVRFALEAGDTGMPVLVEKGRIKAGTGDGAYDVAIRGDDKIAVVAHGKAGLVIVDLANPTELSVLGTYAPGSDIGVGKVRLVGIHAYITHKKDDRSQAGITAVDISNPREPLLPLGDASRFAMDDVEGFIIQNEMIYAAGGTSRKVPRIIMMPGLMAPPGP